MKEDEREEFLQTTKHLVGVETEWPTWIREKCSKLEGSYGLFRRHQEWCELMRGKVAVGEEVWSIISSFIWVVYVITK